jgi:two-component system cell cycle sensor histidine kinase/response regulator CckA
MTEETIKVLIVEDDAAHAELVVDAFADQHGNFDIIVKDNLKGAQDQIEADTPDVVIADINLPDGKGSELVSKDEDSRAFPVIVMTSFGNEELAVEQMKLGVMDYVVKSEHTFATLPHIAERALGEWRAVSQKMIAEDNESRLAAAVSQAAESIMITDADGAISYVNPYFETMTGFSSDEVIGKHASVLSSGKQDEKFYADLWNTISNGKTWKGYFTNKKKDGTLFEEEAVISPVTDESGKITSFVAVKRDVTSERMLENQVRQSQKMAAIGQLAHKVAHDFTNVLSVIIGGSRLAQKKIEPREPEACQYLDDVIKAANNIAMMTSELLSFAHPSSLNLKSIKLSKVVQGVEKMLEKSLPVNVKKVFEYNDNGMKANIDPTQIEQIIVHVAINAAEAMPDGGTLTVRTGPSECERCEDGFVVMTISDTGCGIESDLLQRIFEPFFSTKENDNNPGLGLATAYRIVEQHKGRITVDSSSGEGTTFRILFPVAD